MVVDKDSVTMSKKEFVIRFDTEKSSYSGCDGWSSWNAGTKILRYTGKKKGAISFAEEQVKEMTPEYDQYTRTEITWSFV